MFTFIQVTAQYSNAVLVAVLPHISDFCQKLDLPVSSPITIQQVAHFNCNAKKDFGAGGALALTNGFKFNCSHGIVDAFYDPQSYFFGDTEKVLGCYSNYYGQVNMTQDEAVEMARGALRKLGYDIADLYADGVPVIPPLEGDGTNVIPRFHIKWQNPKFTNALGTEAEFEIDAQNKKIRGIFLFSPFIWREDFKVSAKPKDLASGELPDSVKGNPMIAGAMSGAMGMVPPSEPWTPERQKEVVISLLPQISDYAKRLKMDIPLPLTMKQVASYDTTEHAIGIIIVLTNGCHFFHQGGKKGYITTYEPPYNYWWSGPWMKKADGHVRDYWGQWKMSEEEAVALARETLKKLFPKKTLYLEDKPEIRKPRKIGTNEIPRYSITWEHAKKRDSTSNGDEESETLLDSICSIEIDADKKCVKRIYVLNETDQPQPPPQKEPRD